MPGVNSFYCIEGTISPPVPSQPCGLDPPFPDPDLVSIEYTIESDVLRESLNKYEQYTDLQNTDPAYWKSKLILQVLNTSSIVSMSIIPMDFAAKTILFVQKINCEEGITGFFAPYILSEEQQQKWNAIAQLPQIHTIQKEGQEFEECLRFFLSDNSTLAIVLTYKDSTGNINSLCWKKA